MRKTLFKPKKDVEEVRVWDKRANDGANVVEILLAEDEGMELRAGQRESLRAQVLIAGEAIDGRLL